MLFSIVIELCNHHYNQFRTFSSPKRNCTNQQSLLIPCNSHRPRQPPTYFVSTMLYFSIQTFSFLCVYISHSFCDFFLSFCIQQVCLINQFFCSINYIKKLIYCYCRKFQILLFDQKDMIRLLSNLPELPNFFFTFFSPI